MKLSVVIPVYNEAANFEKLLKKVLDVKIPIDKEVIVVEGGSTDDSREIVKKYDKHPVVKTYYVDFFCGKGYKVKYGIKKSTGDIILIQDADLEYDPAEYPEVLEPILKGETDFVLGSRHLGKNTWKIRTFDYSKWYASIINVGGEGLRLLFWALYGIKIMDPMTMYKVFKKDNLKDFELKSNDFHMDWEIVIKMIKHGHPPIEVPVSYNARSTEEGKKVRIFKDGFLAVWAIFRYRFFD